MANVNWNFDIYYVVFLFIKKFFLIEEWKDKNWWKKILLFGVFSLISAPASLVFACNIGSLDGSDYLNGLPNFDWTNSDNGDGINFDNTNSQNIINNIGNINDLANVKPSNIGHYLNYSKFNTGFQWTQNIKKQAVTGIPLNKGFMPNGNYASDFGITSSAPKYLRMNSILDWNPQKDYDAKYNRATETSICSDI